MSLYREIHDDVFHTLSTRLPAYLTYHSPDHTAYVVDRAEFIAHQEGVGRHDLLLIKIAALFHDIGFIESHNVHEERSCDICREKLLAYRFPMQDIMSICGMILATRIPQQPHTLNEMIVADADLEYLGTDLFYPISQGLYQEFRFFDPGLDLLRFNEIQIRFITHHHYHTDYCRKYKEPKKQENLRRILEAL